MNRHVSDGYTTVSGSDWPFPPRPRIPTRSGTDALRACLRSASLAESTILLPAFICRGAFSRCFEAFDIDPVFVDVDPNTMQIDPARAENHLDSVDAILLNHAFGRPFAVDRWHRLAGNHDTILIEDCARALGAEGGHGPVGSTGQYAIYSFAKVSPLSRGGALVLHDIPPPLPTPSSLSPTVLAHTVSDLLPTRFRPFLARLDALRPSLGQTEPQDTADTHALGLEFLTSLRFERHLRTQFKDSLSRHRHYADRLEAILEREGIRVQEKPRGSVDHVLQTVVPGRRDRLLEQLRAHDYPVHAVWTDPWGPATGSYPIAEYLADHVLTFRLREWSDDRIDRLALDLPHLG